MKDKEHDELNFYLQYLRVHLAEHHFDRSGDRAFIEGRADAALDTYLAEFMKGRPSPICHEMAMRTLLEGLYVSRYDVIYSILEEDCWLRLPPETWEPAALHLAGLKKINLILDRHEVNGDFLAREEYPALRHELLGVISDILEGYGL